MRIGSPNVTVFGPSPLLTVTIEVRSHGGDDIHLHAGGQGVWVARTAGELGANPILCAFLGGETGTVLEPLLEALPGERRLVRTATRSGCSVVDRREGERRIVSGSWSGPVSRHELDDLVSTTCATALRSEVLVVCGAFPGGVLPNSVYGTLVSTARSNGVPVLVDLSSGPLDEALQERPDLVKINDWQLAEWLRAPVDGDRWRPAAERLLERGARAAVVTRGGEPALALRDGQAWELESPHLERGFGEGCGDSMLGAMAAALAVGETWERMLALGAAAGAACFLRRGLGSAKRAVIEELAERVELRPLERSLPGTRR
jgi:1-phosphofructokinase